MADQLQRQMADALAAGYEPQVVADAALAQGFTGEQVQGAMGDLAAAMLEARTAEARKSRGELIADEVDGATYGEALRGPHAKIWWRARLAGVVTPRPTR